MEKDPFDLWWEWAEKPVENMWTIPAEIHNAVMALSAEERCDRARSTRPYVETRHLKIDNWRPRFPLR